MPILDLQRRLREAGRIRIGVQAPIQGKPGKTRPAKLSTFRLTSQDQTAIVAAADLFGGTPRRWEGAPTGEQWEVITEASVIPVVVPPAATAYSAWYELWSGGGCVRRCDAQTEVISDQPCLCASENERTCTPHTRLNMILRDLPGIGVWRLETSGWYAATELAGTVEVIAAAATRGQLLPAVLRLEERQVKRPGEAVKKFAVPVLDITMTPTALGLVVGTTTPAIGSGDRVELASGGTWQPITAPVELEQPDDVTEAIKNPATTGPRKSKRSAPELPPTGLNPRRTPPPDDIDPLADVLSEAQMRKLRALYGEAGINGAADQKRVTAIILGVTHITTHATLTVDQASHVIDQLDRVVNGAARFVLDDQGDVIAVEEAG